MDANDSEASRLVFIMPTPQLRDDVSTVDSTIGPKFYQYHTAPESSDGERLAVQPIFAGEIGRRRAVGDRHSRPRPDKPTGYSEQQNE